MKDYKNVGNLTLKGIIFSDKKSLDTIKIVVNLLSGHCLYPCFLNRLKMKQKVSLNPLQHLVMKLSAREQAYFKRMARIQSNQKNTLLVKLFDLLGSNKSFTTDRLCELLKIQSKTQLSGIKTKLFNDILDMKVTLERNKNINSQLHFAQEQVSILLEKGLFESAEELCTKAIITAKYYAKYQFLSALLHLQNNTKQYKDYKKYKAGSDALFNGIQSANRHEQALQQIRLFYEQVKILGYRTWLPIGVKEMKDIRKMGNMVAEMKQDKTFSQSVREEALIKLYFLNTQALCCYMLHEGEPCIKACLQMLDCWNAFPQLIDEYAELFIHSVNTTSYNDFYCRRTDMARKHISMYTMLASAHLTSNFYSKIFSIIRFNTELKIYHKTFRYDQVKEIVDQQSPIILSYARELLPPPDALSVSTSVCISYFVLEQWDDAETLLLDVKEQNRAVNREDMLFFALMFHLLILYEKKEWYRMDNAIEAAYHFLYARKKLRPFEREMLLFLKHLASARNRQTIKTICKQFLDQLRQMNKKEIPLYSLYFNFPGWVESKMKEMHYMDYAREQAKIKTVTSSNT